MAQALDVCEVDTATAVERIIVKDVEGVAACVFRGGGEVITVVVAEVVE